jgi:fumarate reductase flavoprotein subunit
MDPSGQNLLGMEPANIAFERRGARIERAADARALAAAIDVPADALVKTINTYSDAAAAGTAAQQAIPRSGSALAMRGGLVAMPLAVGLSYTMGGPAIDGDGRVLTDDGPIAGLFAAGSGAASASGGYYGGLATALTIGWRAGRAAALQNR